MKRTLVIIVFFIISLFAYFLQSNFFNWYNISGIQPNFFIILILTIGLYLGEKYGFSLGIILGLLLDLFIGKRIGLNAIMLGIAGLIGGILDRSFSKESRITFMIMTIAVTVLCEVINFTLQIILLGAEPVFMQCMKIIMIEAIYNAILIIILYPLIQKMGNKTEEIFREKKSLMKYY